MPSTCCFELNKPHATYYSGETINGTITLNTTSAKNVRDLSIIFLGEGKVKWQESHSNGSNGTSTTYYRSHEVYVNNSTPVFGEGVLPAGTHTYTFAIPLPGECPTSFEGKFGHIRYEISLRLTRSLRFDNVFKKPLTVIRTVDLNLNPLNRVPLILEECATLCCSSRMIMLTLKIPFAAYAPGQPVNYSLHIANQTMTDVDGYSFEFIKKITFTAKSPSRKKRKKTKTLVAGSFTDSCLRLSTRLIEGHFTIPPIPPTTSSDSIIYIEYKLKFTVHLSGCNSNSKLKIPILIGTIPVRESLPPPQDEGNIQPGVDPTAPDVQTDDSNELPPNYQEFKPPSFEEATRSNSPFVDTDVDERNRIVGFRPLYPMYSYPPYNTDLK